MAITLFLLSCFLISDIRCFTEETKTEYHTLGLKDKCYKKKTILNVDLREDTKRAHVSSYVWDERKESRRLSSSFDCI